MESESSQDRLGSGGIGALWHAARHPPADPKQRFDGKVVLITGATSGIGLEAAVKFASLGASHLILGGRNLARGEAAKSAICQRSGISPSAITLHDLDCNSLASVTRFADSVSNAHPRVDIAVLNAGIAAAAYEVCPETGFESTLQVNVLAQALCAILLLPILQSSSSSTGTMACLEFCASEGYLMPHNDWLDLAPSEENVLEHYSKRENFDQQRQYAISKLLLMFVQAGLVKMVGESSSVSIVAASPGLCRTRLGRDFPLAARVMIGALHLAVARTAEEGSRSLVSGAVLGTEGHGKFWNGVKLNERKPLITHDTWEQVSDREWAAVIKVLDNNCPGRIGGLGILP